MRKCPDMARHLQQRLEPLCYSRLYQWYCCQELPHSQSLSLIHV